MKPLFLYQTNELPEDLQDFLDSDIIVILCIVCLILILIIGVVIFKLYTQTQDINRTMAKNTAEWTGNSMPKPIPKELREMEKEEKED